MEGIGPLEGRLFAAELGGFISHISWRPGEGWRLFLNSWERGEMPTSGYKATYKSLTFDEAVDVLYAEVALRCDWLNLNSPP